MRVEPHGETQVLARYLRERYDVQARLTPHMLLLTALNLANDCDVEYRMARNKRLHVEMALIKMTYIHRAFEISQTPAETAPAEKKNPSPEPAARPVVTAPAPTAAPAATS
jgi:DNA polymerase-3 subunit gamma/tau